MVDRPGETPAPLVGRTGGTDRRQERRCAGGSAGQTGPTAGGSLQTQAQRARSVGWARGGDRGDQRPTHKEDGWGGADRGGQRGAPAGPVPDARCVVGARPSRPSEAAGNVSENRPRAGGHAQGRP